MQDVESAMQNKIVSSYAQTRCNNKKPQSVAAYFDAVSMQSVWVEGKCTPNYIHFVTHSLFAHVSIGQDSTGLELLLTSSE